MKKQIHTIRDFLIPIIDFFYPPFSRIMDKLTFRYAACGGANMLLGLAVYYVGYTYIFEKENFDFGFFAFKPHIAALFLSFIVSFIVGFFLMKFVVFTESNLKGRVQMFRYFLAFIFNLMLNYILLKVLVERLHLKVMFSQILTTVVVVVTSYLIQRNFSFKIEKEDV